MSYTRRRYFATLVSIGTAALAGCSSIVGTDDPTSSTRTTDSAVATATPASEPTTTATPARSPTAVVEKFYAAADSGDFETANALVHPESPEGTITTEEQPVFERQTIRVVAAEVRNREDGVATVDVTLRITREETERTANVTIELRRSDGAWRLYGSSQR